MLFRSDKGSTSMSCYRCGCKTHIAKKCTTSKHLVTLYQQSVKGKKAQENLFEAHFTGPMIKSSQDVQENTENQDQTQQKEGPSLHVEDMLVDFTSTSDIYGDQL